MEIRRSRRRRGPRSYRPRLVHTELPADGIFRFSAPARREGRADKGGLRATIPRPVVRGLQLMGWDGTWLRVRIGAGDHFTLRARHPRTTQTVISLPKARRGEVSAGEAVELELVAARRRK